MHDGQNVFQDQSAIGGYSLQLEKYLDEKEAEVIVVAIDQNKKERINEYCPWVNGGYSQKILGQTDSSGGKGKQYIDFIVKKLKPFIDSNYRTLKGRTGIAGISLGGLISIYAMCQHPQIFRNIVVLSSAFYRNQEEIEKLIYTSDLSFIESVYLGCGTKEAGDEQSINKAFIGSNQAVYEMLKQKTPCAKFEIVEGAKHNYLNFKERATAILASFMLNRLN